MNKKEEGEMVCKIQCRNILTILIASFFVSVSCTSFAATVGFTVDVSPSQDIESTPIWPSDCSGNCNWPTFLITNDSGFASITSFSMTIGDAYYNYDDVRVNDDGGIGYTLTSPLDGSSGGARANEFSFTFSGFSAATSFFVTIDVDPDSRNSYVDFRNILFNNGSASNAVATATFSTGQILTASFSEEPVMVEGENAYRLSAQASVVPIPPAVWLFGSGLIGLIGVARRKV